jgi:tetratricopeptide (TPR) repeat protein
VNVNHAIRDDPSVPDYWVIKGRILAKINETVAAERSYNTAINLDYETRQAWIYKGELYEQIGEYQMAYKMYTTAIKVDPNYVYAKTKRDAIVKKGFVEPEVEPYVYKSHSAGDTNTEATLSLSIPIQSSNTESHSDARYENDLIQMIWARFGNPI